MINKTHITVIIGCAVLLWTAALWLLALPFTLEYLKPFTIVVTLLSALVFAFNKWFWHWPIFRGWLVKRPYIHGHWKVTLISNYVPPDKKKAIDPIPATMDFRQTFSSIFGRLTTPQSSSTLTANSLTPGDDGEFDFTAIYLNEPDIEHRPVSDIHYGSFRLRVTSYTPDEMKGIYWTDRSTQGSMHLKLASRKIPN